jgi:hypothetical protein
MKTVAITGVARYEILTGRRKSGAFALLFSEYVFRFLSNSVLCYAQQIAVHHARLLRLDCQLFLRPQLLQHTDNCLHYTHHVNKCT